MIELVRVLHIVISMDMGGLETFIMNIYRKIDRNKVQFDFLMHTDKECVYSEEIRRLGGKIFNVPARNKGIWNNKKAVNDFFKSHSEYRIVHQHVNSLSYIEPLKAARKHGVPVRIIHGHSTKEGGSMIHKYIHHWNQLIFSKQYATDNFACSDLSAKWLLGEKRYKSGEYQIINNGIDTELFSFRNEVRNRMRKELNITDTFVIGLVGRFSYPKNHEFLIDIFEELHKKNNDAVLLLVGDGKMRSTIESKLIEKGLMNSTILTGVRSDITDILQAMDVFVMPSHYEGLPVSLVEAQATGLPCVVSDVITKQVEITEKIKYVSLDTSAEKWADSIIQISSGYVRKEEKLRIIKSGFDVNQIALFLQNYYLSKG